MSYKKLYLSMMFMAEADDVVCRSERALISSLCQFDEECDVGDVVIDDIPVDPKTDSKHVLKQCVRLSLIDGHYDESEKERFYLLAGHFGVAKKEAEDIEAEEMKMKWLSSGGVIEMP